ncbi:MAG: DUF448 domain-containing protein [Armatimonadetes bacterium]|nr:DUF448 domain-containing protein [Armatimonadota bacterium]
MPIRSCIVCKARLEQKALYRVVASHASGQHQPASGRSAYVCLQSNCREQFVTKDRLDRALRVRVTPDFKAQLKKEILCHQ